MELATCKVKLHMHLVCAGDVFVHVSSLCVVFTLGILCLKQNIIRTRGGGTLMRGLRYTFSSQQARTQTHTYTNARTHTHTHLKPHVLTWLRRYFPFLQFQFENLRNEASAAIMPHWMWKACQHGSVVFVSHLFQEAGGFERLTFIG